MTACRELTTLVPVSERIPTNVELPGHFGGCRTQVLKLVEDVPQLKPFVFHPYLGKEVETGRNYQRLRRRVLGYLELLAFSSIAQLQALIKIDLFLNVLPPISVVGEMNGTMDWPWWTFLERQHYVRQYNNLKR